MRALISKRQRRRIDTSWRFLPPKRANKFARAFRGFVHPSIHPSIHPAPTDRYLVLVLARPILSCPPQCVSSVQPHTTPLPLRSSTKHVLSRVQNVLAICFSRSFAPLPSLTLLPRTHRFSLSLRSPVLSFFPFTPRAIFLISSLFLRARTRALTRARERWARKSTDDICRT